MISKSKTVQICCRSCSQNFPYEHWTQVSCDDSPGLKAKILSGDLFHVACPHCNRPQYVIPNLQYFDSKKNNFFVYLLDEDQMHAEREFIESLSILKMNGTRLHIAHSTNELQTIVKLYDHGVKHPESHIFPSKKIADKNAVIQKNLDELVGKIAAQRATPDNKRKGTSLWKKLFSGFLAVKPDAAISNGEEPRESVFHVVLELPPRGRRVDPNSVLVLADAWVKRAPDGTNKYGVRVNKGADPFAVVEANSAVYWRRRMDLNDLTKKQCISWVQSLERTTPNKYLIPEKDAPDAVSDMALYCALARASLHYAIAKIKILDCPASVVNWHATNVSKGKDWVRFPQIESAGHLGNAISSGAIDSRFLTHLARSVGGLQMPKESEDARS